MPLTGFRAIHTTGLETHQYENGGPIFSLCRVNEGDYDFLSRSVQAFPGRYQPTPREIERGLEEIVGILGFQRTGDAPRPPKGQGKDKGKDKPPLVCETYPDFIVPVNAILHHLDLRSRSDRPGGSSRFAWAHPFVYRPGNDEGETREDCENRNLKWLTACMAEDGGFYFEVFLRYDVRGKPLAAVRPVWKLGSSTFGVFRRQFGHFNPKNPNSMKTTVVEMSPATDPIPRFAYMLLTVNEWTSVACAPGETPLVQPTGVIVTKNTFFNVAFLHLPDDPHAPQFQQRYFREFLAKTQPSAR